jgi:uncharacterized delta-60 repeat protein
MIVTTPSARHTRLVAALLVAGLGAPGAAQAADPGPAVSVAPGRVVFAVDAGKVKPNVDAVGASLATGLPDGGTLMFGFGDASRDVLHIAKLGAGGALDRSFGTGGVASLATPPAGRSLFSPSRILRQSDGKLLMVSTKDASADPFAAFQLQVTRLNADATIDRSYGVNGTAATAINETCGGSCSPVALAPDGSLVLTGATGDGVKPPAEVHNQWALTRLTPAGAVDHGFGTDGIATIGTAGSTRGFNVAVRADGTIVTGAWSQVGTTARTLLTRLTAAGAPDPAFAGGTPVDVPLQPGFLMLLQDDGSVVLNGQTPGSDPSVAGSGSQLLTRYTAAGVPDATFGSAAIVDLGSGIGVSQLLPTAGHGVLVVAAHQGQMNVRRLQSNGMIDPSFSGPNGRDVVLPFGGGGSSFVVSQFPRPVQTLLQNTFGFQASPGASPLVARADGSFVMVAGVRVSQPTGEGAGYSIGRFAAAALTPAFALDTAFGGPATKPHASVSLSLQRASTAHTRHGIRIQLKASAVGLARVKIVHGDRAIALSLLPVFTTSRTTLPVELTSYGNTYLRTHRNVRVTITATARDLLTNTTTATARGRLR